MRYTVLTSILCASAAVAQQVNTTVLTELAQALTAAGLTSLASLAAQIVNTTEGQTLLGTITNTTANLTLLAPSNAALGKISKNASSSDIATLLSYHVVQGPYLNTSYFFDTPNNTILQTFLNDTATVQLEGNHSQVLVATVEKGTITLLNQSPVINVTAATNFSNFDILTIDGVLTPPPSISSIFKSAGLTAATQALASANLTDALDAAHGVTVFAPTNAAFEKAAAALGSQATNETLIQIIIENHIINGTSVYSSFFSNSYTSAGGEGLSFSVSGNTTLVLSGGSGSGINATITTKDLLASNGVVHIIDTVLANNQSNPGAASSAFSSATSAAASPTSATGPVGATPSTSPSNDAPMMRRAAPILAAIAVAAVGGLCVML